jgi:hypothetical protein
MTSRFGFRFAIAAAALFSLGAPLRAQAGGATTAHPVTMTLKTVTQMTTGSGDSKPDKVTGTVKDVFELCTGAPATKTQGIYFFINCGFPNDNTIAAIETNPLGLIATVGEVSFDLLRGVQTTKSGGATLKAVTVPVEVTIDCAGSTTTATMEGIMDLTFSDLAGQDCLDSAKVKLTGSGHSTVPGDFIIDDGSQFQAKKRSASISSFPPP